MNKFFDSLYEINNNILVFTPLVVKFYENLEPTQKNILLAYLVLPLVLYENNPTRIKNLKKTSNIFTFTSRNNKDMFFGLEKRIQQYKNITTKCILYAKYSNFIQFNEDMSIRHLKSIDNKLPNLNEAYLASSKLYNVFKNLDVITIYKYLGVKKL